MRMRKHKVHEEAELDITSFMNLMIILVPVLLISMVFARTTVLDLKLPDLASGSGGQEENENLILEVVIREDYLDVNYPAGTLLKRLPNKPYVDPEADTESEVEAEAQTSAVASENAGADVEMVHDYELLSLVLQEVKRQLKVKGIEKRDILLLSEPDTNYQELVSAMDAIRSYKALVVTDVVDAELFPDLSLGDAPDVAGLETGSDQASLPSETAMAGTI